MGDGGFWLPPELLAEALFLGDAAAADGNGQRRTNADDAAYLAALTRQMAQASLQARYRRPKTTMAVSRESSLCDLGIWPGFSNGSPRGSSPLLLSAAARFRLGEPAQQLHGHGVMGLPAKSSLIAPAHHRRPSGLYEAPPQLSQQQLQAQRFYQLRQQQLLKQRLSAAASSERVKSRGGDVSIGHPRPVALPSPSRPPLQRLQQHPKSGMRAVFLTGSGTRKVSSGTGVFLPRNPTEPPPPPPNKAAAAACSMVLLPDRVIKALNLKLDEMAPPPRKPPSASGLDHSGKAATAASLRRRTSPNAGNCHRLPLEWNY